MKKTIGLLTIGALCIASASAFAGTKIGVVNYQTVFQQAPQGKATLTKLQDQLKPKLASLKKDQEALTKQIKDFQRNQPTLSKSESKKQQAALTQSQHQFQAKVLAMRDQEMKKEKVAADTFQNDLNNAIRMTAKRSDYDLIMNSQAVPYAENDYNITSKVVHLMKHSA